MKWEILVLWESCNHLGDHCRSYFVDSLVKALKERDYIKRVEPTASVFIKRVRGE